MKPLENITITEDWLKDAALQKLFDILCADNGEAMVAGGAVRNALMGIGSSDVDVCTTVLPGDVVHRLEAAGEKAVPTGLDHGTVTAVIDGNTFEVTTLREDVETDGRHAVVKFGTDWLADANRRDLTMNALYCDRDGRIFDPLGGIGDVEEKNVRFIGDPVQRIKEDSLRILRFFRFFAWYGSGRPDAAGLKACAANKMLLSGLSMERVWSELKQLLRAPDPGRAILWMRTTGILGGVIPETHKWGTDAIPGLLRYEQENDLPADPLFRIMGMVRPDVETMNTMGKRMTFSNAEIERMVDWADNPAPKPDTTTEELDKLLYQGSPQGFVDSMRLETVHLLNREDEKGADAMQVLVNHAKVWEKPVFPVKGQDLIEKDVSPGPDMGEKLKTLEIAWVESNFSLSKEELLNL